ncbi:MAG: ketoacyl-ACP synthase III [Leptospiraceae bacterium]|nr:ketoacyl-ACP synthase III [Leptospiraceae bacterium]
MKELISNGLEFKGIGHYLPETIITNEDIRTRLKYPEMHPAEKAVMGDIGVNKRHRSSEKEDPIFMASKVAEMALKDANISPEEIDLFLLANWTDRSYVPELAPRASDLSGTKNALAFDISTACSGFVHGVMMASAYAATGRFKKILVIGSERFSIRTKIGGYGEFTAGDAAAGVVLEQTGKKNTGVYDYFLKDYGNLHDIIMIGPPPQSYIKSFPTLPGNASRLTLEAIDKLLKDNSLSANDIDWFIPHPGTDVVLQDVLANCPFPKEKILFNFPEVGNTSAASIPIVMSEFYSKGKLKHGDLVLACAVGAGFYSGGLLFRF